MYPYLEKLNFNRRIFGMSTRLKFTVFVILLATGYSVTGQKRDSVTNEELHKYAVMMDSLETLKKQRTEMSTRLAKGNSKITASRYSQLLPIIDDQKKLAETKATAVEIAYVKDALTKLNQEGQKFQTAFTSLLNEYVGYDTYNKVRRAISNNPKVKDRFDVEINRINGIFYSKG